MRKTFLVLCIVALILLGLNAVPGGTATADSDFAIGNLSNIAKELGVTPGENGKYNLVSILEALYASVENTNKQVSDLETRITKLGDFISSLQVEVSNIRQAPTQVTSDQLNKLAEWTERELNRLWDNWNDLDNLNIESRLRQIENQLRQNSGSSLDTRLRQMESRIQRIEWTLQESNTDANDSRLRQIESNIQQMQRALNDLQNQINNLRR